MEVTPPGVPASLHPPHLPLRGSVPGAAVPADGAETLHPVSERERRGQAAAAAAGVCVPPPPPVPPASPLSSHLSSSAAPQSSGTAGGRSGTSAPPKPASVSVLK